MTKTSVSLFQRYPCTTLSSLSRDHHCPNLSKYCRKIAGIQFPQAPVDRIRSVVIQFAASSSIFLASAITLGWDGIGLTDRNNSGICKALASAACEISPSEARESITDLTGDSLLDLNICLRRSGVEGASGPLGFLTSGTAGA
jgi:hypothetical protein